MQKIYLFVWLLAILPMATFSQKFTQTIRGKVVDLDANSPIQFATIAIPKLNLGTTTDSLGYFVLKNIPVGRYTLKFSMVGYEPYLVEELQISSAKETVLNISLKERLNSLTEVVIKPKINKESALNSTATLSARMLSVEEAQRYAGGFDDPARLVSSFAGVASNVSNNAIVVRGNSPQALQWKMEGVEIPNPNHFADMSSFGGGGLTALSSQLLANSDFISGAMPAEYNNALSGVFDIFMRNGNNQKAEHTFQLGLLGIDFASEGPLKQGGKSSYLFNYRYSTLSLLEPIMPENAGGTTYQDFSFKMNFPTKKAGTFALWGIGLMDGSDAVAKSDSTDWRYDSDRENQVVKQFMGAAGLSHHYNLSRRQFIKTTLAATISGIDANTDRLDNSFALQPKSRIGNNNSSLILSTTLHTKFHSKQTNKTGFTATLLGYDLSMSNRDFPGKPLLKVVAEQGNTLLLAAFTNSTLHLGEKSVLNAGINLQYFALTGKYSCEPRIGLQYQLTPASTVALTYGLHSRTERLNYYFVQNSKYGTARINQKLDFSKAHHLVAGWSAKLSDKLHLKIESYYQQLFSIPVIADSSFSLINVQNDWFFQEKLINSGKGRNYGIDLALDRYLSRGYYYMATASLFRSEYMGGDHIWRESRYNRQFVINLLAGKEWQTGKQKKNVWGLNGRLSYQGGDRFSPIDLDGSRKEEQPIFFEAKAFSEQFAPSFTCHFTISYKINKAKSTHELALKVLNATGYQEFTGFQYNRKSQMVEEGREALTIPNLSYKIEF